MQHFEYVRHLEQVFEGSKLAFDLDFDFKSQNARGWSVSGEYWTEVSNEGDDLFKINVSLNSP